MKMSRIEVIKTVLIAVLLVALVCLCSVYMLSYRGISDAEFGKEQMDRLGGKSVKYQYLKYTDASYVFPEFIGLSNGEKHYGFAGPSETSASLYADIFPFYEKLFGAEGHTEVLSAKEGEKLFADAVQGEYFFIRYACDLPKSILMGMTSKDGTAADTSGEFLCELFILPDSRVYDGLITGANNETVRAAVFTFHALARDGAGHYYRYTTDYVPKGQTDIGYHQNYYIAYTAKGEAKRYAFATEKNDAFFTKMELSRLVTDTTVLFDTPLAGKELTLLRTSPDEDGERAILKAFLMNPEKISSYTDESGTRAYFDEGKSVRFMKNGEVRYAALGQSGVSLDELFGYHPDGSEYDALDYVGAALLLADTLGIQNEGGRSVYLSRMNYDGETLSISLGYRYGGLPLLADGTEEVFRVDIQDGVIRGVSLRPYTVEETGETVATSDFTFALRGYLTTAETRHRLLPMISFSDGADKGRITAVAVSVEEGEGEQ